jgi:DNA polymerase-3 subunit delta'
MWQTIGQPKALDLLQRAFKQGTLAHAYLIEGPLQVGKMVLALDLAMVLNCQAESSQKPCGKCPSCQKILSGKHSDVQVIGLNQNLEIEDTKSRTEIGIEKIREVLHTASLPPFEGNYRVYIIDEASHLSLDAANCLLKTLEEPQGKVVFILISANPQLIPATIISRCQRISLSRMKTSDIESALVSSWQVEPGKARLLARLSYGCLGWAIQAVGEPKVLEERNERFEEMLNLVRNDYSGRFAVASRLATQFGKKRETVYEILDEWLSWWRDLLLVKTGCTHNITNIDFGPALDEMAGGFDLAQIKLAIQNIRKTEEYLKLNVNARLALESLMLNLPKPAVNKIGRVLAEVKNA